jgi:hypothetical protein
VRGSIQYYNIGSIKLGDEHLYVKLRYISFHMTRASSEMSQTHVVYIGLHILENNNKFPVKIHVKPIFNISDICHKCYRVSVSFINECNKCLECRVGILNKGEFSWAPKKLQQTSGRIFIDSVDLIISLHVLV